MNYKHLENLPTEVLFTIALNLRLPGILNMCRSNPTINKRVCENDLFWKAKFRKDMIKKHKLGYPAVINDNLINFIIEASEKDPDIPPYIIKMARRGLSTIGLLTVFFLRYFKRNKLMENGKIKADALMNKYFSDVFDELGLADAQKTDDELRNIKGKINPRFDRFMLNRLTKIIISLILGYYPNKMIKEHLKKATVSLNRVRLRNK